MSEAMKILILGGSGFVSGTLARLALARGHQVWAVTRGQRALPQGVTGLAVGRTWHACCIGSRLGLGSVVEIGLE